MGILDDVKKTKEAKRAEEVATAEKEEAKAKAEVQEKERIAIALGEMLEALEEEGVNWSRNGLTVENGVWSFHLIAELPSEGLTQKVRFRVQVNSKNQVVGAPITQPSVMFDNRIPGAKQLTNPGLISTVKKHFSEQFQAMIK